MQAVKDTYNDDTSNTSGNVILLKIQTQLKNIKSFYHVNNFGLFNAFWYFLLKSIHKSIVTTKKKITIDY